MKVSIHWLKEFVKIPWPAKELAHRLVMAGLEVEAIEGEGDGAILEIAITPNRGDCLSILGLAREIAALQGLPLKPRAYTVPKGEGKIRDVLTVKNLDSKNCPRYMTRMISGVTIKPSPEWLQQRLESAGLRPINNVVDCTNYVMWELGHPLHAFDARFLRHNTIVVRREASLTKFKTLDGEIRDCLPEDLFICDGEGPVALAGIMGGANSEVREDTTDIVLESAFFEPRRIHATSRRLGLVSDSSYRFARGVDPNGLPNALHRVCQLIVETSGGVPTEDWADLYPKKRQPIRISLKTEEVERILGFLLPAGKIKKHLQSLGFKFLNPPLKKGGRGDFQIDVPTFRFDISLSEDLIEEIARLEGYDKIPATMPTVQAGCEAFLQSEETMEKRLVADLASLGFSETIGLPFVSEAEAKTYGWKGGGLVPIANPLSSDQTHMTPSLLPGLLRALAFNTSRQRSDVKLFALRKVFSESNGKMIEKTHLGILAQGLEWPLQWQIKPKPVDIFSLKGLLDRYAAMFHLKLLELEGSKISWIGSLNGSSAYALEVDWSAWKETQKGSVVAFKELSKFPFIERDLAMIVNAKLEAKKFTEKVAEFANPWIEKVQFFDLYQGKGLPPNQKSVALHIRYASKERTLTNEEVNLAHQALIAHLETTLPGKLR